MNAIFKVNRPKTERALRERSKKEMEYLMTLPDIEKVKAGLMVSGNREYVNQLKRKSKNTFGF